MADQQTKQIILNRFAGEGIPADRIILVPQQIELARHFEYYSNVDLGLDTFTYNGTTTTCEALWMNVPVLTLEGKTHIARVGASLLTNAGLPQMVATTPEQFVQLAVKYATDHAALVELRRGLRQKFHTSAVMDGKRFAAEFGASLRTMWRQWCANPK